MCLIFNFYLRIGTTDLVLRSCLIIGTARASTKKNIFYMSICGQNEHLIGAQFVVSRYLVSRDKSLKMFKILVLSEQPKKMKEHRKN